MSGTSFESSCTFEYAAAYALRVELYPKQAQRVKLKETFPSVPIGSENTAILFFFSQGCLLKIFILHIIDKP